MLSKEEAAAGEGESETLEQRESTLPSGVGEAPLCSKSSFAERQHSENRARGGWGGTSEGRQTSLGACFVALPARTLEAEILGTGEG